MPTNHQAQQQKNVNKQPSSGIFAQIDTRDIIALIGLSLLGSGLYFVYPPAALIVPGGILAAKALLPPRHSGDDDGHSRQH